MIRRRLSWSELWRALFSASRTTCMIILIIICAQIFGYYFTLTGFTQSLVAFVGELDVSRWVIFLLIILIYLALGRSEEHTSELQSLMRISYAVFCLKKKKQQQHIAKNHKLHKLHIKQQNY